MTMTEHNVRARNLRPNDIIMVDNEHYVIFAIEPFTASIVEVHVCHVDRPDIIVTSIRLFNDRYIAVFIPA